MPWLLLFGCAGLDPADCVPATVDDVLDRTGDYYRCLDTQLAGGEGCGAAGYPLGYGAKYADRYLTETYPAVSPEGQEFLRAVAPCLQVELAAWVTADASCDAVWDHGFATHAGCYADHGFCGLDIADAVAIAAAVDEADRALPEADAQTTELLERCAALAE
ncbi:MAG: hypothetical protein ABMA64_41055 [Myxococcota bacterium]